MPRDMIYKHFDGFVLGSEVTCNIQGFFSLFGTLASAFYNGVLYVYYLCSIVLRMTDKQFKRFPEPLLHVCTFFFSMCIPCVLVIGRGINPSPSLAWCHPGDYPWWCNSPVDDIDQTCGLRDDRSTLFVTIFRIASAVIVIGTAIIGIISFIFIIWTIYNRERMLVSSTTDIDDRRSGTSSENERELNTHRHDLQYTKAVTVQCLAYIFSGGAFFIPIAIYSMRRFHSIDLIQGQDGIRRVCLILWLLQGLFNFLIFIFLKVYTMLRIQGTDFSLYGALTTIIFPGENEEEEYAVSNISLVIIDNERNRIDLAFDARYRGAVSLDDQPNSNGVTFPVRNDASNMIDSDVLSASFDSKKSSQQNLSGFDSQVINNASSYELELRPSWP